MNSNKFHLITGLGGYSYLYEPLWWAGMITSKIALFFFIVMLHSPFLVNAMAVSIYLIALECITLPTGQLMRNKTC